MPLRSLIYVSSAHQLLSQEELVALLQVSRRNNVREDVTGMLLYKGGNFMQAIEGEREAVERLHARISRDPRHHGVFTLLDRQLERREFPEWSMGFQNLTEVDLSTVAGFSDFLSGARLDQPLMDGTSRALKLLGIFRRQNR